MGLGITESGALLLSTGHGGFTFGPNPRIYKKVCVRGGGIRLELVPDSPQAEAWLWVKDQACLDSEGFCGDRQVQCVHLQFLNKTYFLFLYS